MQTVEKTVDSLSSPSRSSVDKRSALRTVSPSGEKRETTTTTTKFQGHSPEASTTAGNISSVAAAAAAALSHQRMLMSPLPFDRVSRRLT